MYKQCNLTLCATLVIITVAVLAETETKKKANENSRNVTCKGKPMNMAPLMVGHKECHEKIFNKAPLNPRELDDEARKELEKQWAENEMCYNVCIWKKHEIINADGSYDEDGTDKLVKAVFSIEVQADLKKSIDECASENSKSFSMDNKCEGYKGFLDCKMANYFQICEIDPKGQPGM